MSLIQRILLPTDFSEYSTHAVPYACALAEEYAAELHVLHVLEKIPTAPYFGMGLTTPGFTEESEQRARQLLEHVLPANWPARKGGDGPQTRIAVRGNDPLRQGSPNPFDGHHHARTNGFGTHTARKPGREAGAKIPVPSLNCPAHRPSIRDGVRLELQGRARSDFKRGMSFGNNREKARARWLSWFFTKLLSSPNVR